MADDASSPRMTVAITTRNRPDELFGCLRSLAMLAPMDLEIVVVDDASDEPFAPRVGEALGPGFPWPVRVIRHDVNSGLVAARNEMAREASAPLILSLDDDARLLDAESVTRALEVIESDPDVGAIGFAQLRPDGTMFPAGGQPSGADYDCEVPSYRGYAHLVRRDLFLRLGSYRGLFWYGGEEDEFCKRLMDSGSKVVYLPRSRVIHGHSPIGRDELVRMRCGTRNACLDAMYNEPLPRAVVTVPGRILRYARLRKGTCRYYGLDDTGGLRWIVGQLARNAPAVWGRRKALKWSTYRRWKALRLAPPPYPAAPALRGEQAVATIGAAGS